MRTWIYAVVIPVLFVQLANAAQEAGDMEKPPVLKAADLAPRDVPLKGEHYRVDDAVPTDGYLAAFTLKTDFGTVEARGPGVLRTRVAEVAAIALELIDRDPCVASGAVVSLDSGFSP